MGAVSLFVLCVTVISKVESRSVGHLVNKALVPTQSFSATASLAETNAPVSVEIRHNETPHYETTHDETTHDGMRQDGTTYDGTRQDGKKRLNDPCVPSDALKQQCTAAHTGYDLLQAWIANPDAEDLKFFKSCIVDYYCFVKDPNGDAWTTIPTLGDALGSDYMTNVALRVKQFFIRNNKWDETKADAKYRVAGGSCLNLLYVTAARYLFVTYVMYDVSNGNVAVCTKDAVGKTVMPVTVCYPPNYGSQTCTSDYDVGLVGPQSGTLTALFNEYFQDATDRGPGFGIPSEEVFDTNIYAYTLEYAMPGIYSGLSREFVAGVASRQGSSKYQMQEIASAIFKVYKYQQAYALELFTLSKTHLPDAWAKQFKDWYSYFTTWEKNVEEVINDNRIEDFRKRNNKVYTLLVQDISTAAEENGLLPEYMAQISLALIYAAEAYHTRGAIRHVVGCTQMKNQAICQSLGQWDYWPSMLENWGDSLKEYDHCKAATVEVCLVKMSKYMWRTFDAMKGIRAKLPGSDVTTLMDIGEAGGVERTMLHWLNDLKKNGISSIPLQDKLTPASKPTDTLALFLQAFKCNSAENDIRGKPLSATCLDKMRGVIGSYHTTLLLQVKKGVLNA